MKINLGDLADNVEKNLPELNIKEMEIMRQC